MKKILMAMLALTVMASAALAGVGIDWLGYWGGYNDTVADPLTGVSSSDSIRAANSVIWQLVWAGNDGIQAPDQFNSGNGYVSGNDQVLATRTMTAGTGMITDGARECAPAGRRTAALRVARRTRAGLP